MGKVKRRPIGVTCTKPHLEPIMSAKTAEEMLAVFQDMEASLDETDLGLASMKVAAQLQKEGKDPEQALSFAHKALKNLDEEGEHAILVSLALHLIGCVNLNFERYDDSLEYLTRAERLLGRIEKEGLAKVEDIRTMMRAVYDELANVNTSLGRVDEALDSGKKSLEILEMTGEMGRMELAEEYRTLANALLHVSNNFKEALPLGLKVLEIHREELGEDSVEVAHDRKLLGAIYSCAGEHDKALEQFELSRKVKHCLLSSDLLSVEMDAAEMQISLGKYDEAFNTMKGIFQQTKDEKDSENQASMFILIGKALCDQGKFADSKGCLEFACKILDKKEAVSPRFVTKACIDVAEIYEDMNDFETAVSFLKRALVLIKKEPQETHAEGTLSARLRGTLSARIGRILLSGGQIPRAIPYLESAAERLKESFSSDPFVSGHNYNNLGIAYLESERPQLAAQMFAAAKDNLDVSRDHGPHHQDSIVARQNLSIAYSTMGSYSLAIQFQQQVVDAWKVHGPTAQYEFRKALRTLKELKKKACGTSSNQLPTKALLLPLP
ncbi:hypothetical protein PTKIN_Ptkin10aG0197600 [Pterospermum kingtungense]